LRGAKDGQPAPSSETNDVIVESTDCGCNSGACTCTNTSSHPDAKSEQTEEEQQGHEKLVKDQASALSAWWQKQPQDVRNLPCSCALGASECSCHGSNELESGAKEAAEALRSEAEQSLSLWWVAGGWHRGWRHHGYPGGGVHCGRAGYGGCGCHYYGCHCGRVRFGGCRRW